MTSLIDLAPVSKIAIETCAGIRPGESVVILAETATPGSLADAFFAASVAAGAETALITYKTRSAVNVEHSPPVAAAMARANVILDVTVNYTIHTQAYEAARQAGARCLMTMGDAVPFLLRGVVGVDFHGLRQRGLQLVNQFAKARQCVLTTPQGTRLEMEIRGRPSIVRDGMALEKGEIDYFPGAQLSLAPVEDTINGDVVVNGTIFPPIGKLVSPVKLLLKGGKLVDVAGPPHADELATHLRQLADDKMYYVAHLTIGLNPKATHTGVILEDERVAGAVVLGFGSQMPEFQGRIGRAKSHLDAVTYGATLRLDDTLVVHEGKVV